MAFVRINYEQNLAPPVRAQSARREKEARHRSQARRRIFASEPLRADAHWHQNVEKWRLNFQDAGAHLVDEVEKNFVLGQVAQRRH